MKQVMRLGAFFALWVQIQPASALTVTLDYSYDSGFFTAERQAVLSAAANAFETRLQDNLLAVTSGGGNNFSAVFNNPSSGAQVTLSNYSVSADEVVVYVGAQSLGGSLGYGGPGGFSVSYSSIEYLDLVTARGQAGALAATPTDFGPWGGAITFNSDAGWYADPNPGTVEGFSGLNDLYSVAVHELGHVLGIGTADSWAAQIAGSDFAGAASVAAYGSAVPLAGDASHWDNSVWSFVAGAAQEAAMTPALLVGSRKFFTDLDYAALSDIGWEVTPVPELETWVMLSAGVGMIGLWFGRRRAVCAPAGAA